MVVSDRGRLVTLPVTETGRYANSALTDKGFQVEGAPSNTVALTGRFDLGLTERPALAIVVPLAGRLDLGQQSRGALSTDSGLAGRLVLGLNLAGNAGETNALAGRLELGLATRAPLYVVVELGGQLDLGLTARPALKVFQPLSGRLELALWPREDSTGPGSGFIVAGQTVDTLLAALREGDEFPCTLPYAGISGQSGVARVLQRLIDAQGVLTFKLAFFPTTDGPSAQAQALSGPPRTVPPTRDHAGRRLADIERQLTERL